MCSHAALIIDTDNWIYRPQAIVTRLGYQNNYYLMKKMNLFTARNFTLSTAGNIRTSKISVNNAPSSQQYFLQHVSVNAIATFISSHVETSHYKQNMAIHRHFNISNLMCVCPCIVRAVQHPSSLTHSLLTCTWPPTTSNQALHTTGGNNTHIVSSSWWWAQKCPKQVEHIISAINHCGI